MIKVICIKDWIFRGNSNVSWETMNLFLKNRGLPSICNFVTGIEYYFTIKEDKKLLSHISHKDIMLMWDDNFNFNEYFLPLSEYREQRINEILE